LSASDGVSLAGAAAPRGAGSVVDAAHLANAASLTSLTSLIAAFYDMQPACAPVKELGSSQSKPATFKKL